LPFVCCLPLFARGVAVAEDSGAVAIVVTFVFAHRWHVQPVTMLNVSYRVVVVVAVVVVVDVVVVVVVPALIYFPPCTTLRMRIFFFVSFI